MIDFLEMEDEGKQSIRTRDKVFVIHGHNEARLLELKILLTNEFNLNPIILKEQPEGGVQTIIEKFEKCAKGCKYAIALFTPDDEVENNGKKYLQARPNVLFELGWLTKKLTRKRIMLLVQEGTTVFSDFQGIIQLRFKMSIEEQYKKIRDELDTAGLLKRNVR
jgi:predicted nucleotide-binding protein